MTDWFAVDKAGLAALTARRGKSFVLAELLSNAWDAPEVTRVSAAIGRGGVRGEAEIRVEDDSPDGFSDMAHAFTLFADTAKRANPTQRGRFNLGEKLTLALASTARIQSTRGTVEFGPTGRHASRRRRAAGSEIVLTLRMTATEIEDAIAHAMTFIPPIETTINGVRIPDRAPLATLQARLPTELMGEDGAMRRMERTAEIAVYRAVRGEGWLYELGVPVCATGDTFDVDVRQKVPVSLERESVSDAYLRRARAAVLAGTAHLLDADTARAPWVTQALEAAELPASAVEAVIEQRFGGRAVVYDPSDPEANKIATSKGYTVVHGGAFSAAAWKSIRGAAALKPAGQVTPAPRPWAENGTPTAPIDPTPAMARFAAWCERLAGELLGETIRVQFYAQFNDRRSAAAYGQRVLQFNVGRLGRAWFDGPIREAHIDLLLHEFGHHYESDHLSRRFSDALTRLGAKLAMLAARAPDVLQLGAESPAPVSGGSR